MFRLILSYQFDEFTFVAIKYNKTNKAEVNPIKFKILLNYIIFVISLTV